MARSIRDRRWSAAGLLAAWIVWSLVSLSAAVHFHAVAHAVDPVTGETVHQHAPAHADGRGSPASPTDPRAERARALTSEPAGSGADEREICALLSAAIHASSLPGAAPSLAEAPRVDGARAPAPPVRDTATVDLLSLAPKQSPPRFS